MDGRRVSRAARAHDGASRLDRAGRRLRGPAGEPGAAAISGNAGAARLAAPELAGRHGAWRRRRPFLRRRAFFRPGGVGEGARSGGPAPSRRYAEHLAALRSRLRYGGALAPSRAAARRGVPSTRSGLLARRRTG